MFRIDCTHDGCSDTRMVKKISKRTIPLCALHLRERQQAHDRQRVLGQYVKRKAEEGLTVNSKDGSSALHNKYFPHMLLYTEGSFPTGGVLSWNDIQETLDWGYFPPDMLLLNMRSKEVFAIKPRHAHDRGQVEMGAVVYPDPDYPPQKLVRPLDDGRIELAAQAIQKYAYQIREWDKVNLKAEPMQETRTVWSGQ